MSKIQALKMHMNRMLAFRIFTIFIYEYIHISYQTTLITQQHVKHVYLFFPRVMRRILNIFGRPIVYTVMQVIFWADEPFGLMNYA